MRLAGVRGWVRASGVLWLNCVASDEQGSARFDSVRGNAKVVAEKSSGIRMSGIRILAVITGMN
jgi:hypothetical protein